MFVMLKLKSPSRKGLKQQTPQVTKFTLQDRVRECKSVIEQTSHLKYKHIFGFETEISLHNFSTAALVYACSVTVVASGFLSPCLLKMLKIFKSFSLQLFPEQFFGSRFLL